MEKRVLFEIKSKFNNLHINVIREWNCDDIKRSLSVVMKKAHAPEKLHLQFEGKMNATMIKMTEDYKDKITSLGFRAKDNEDLLLHPSFIFKSLESLSLNRRGCTDDTMVRVCEAMLAKHANNLKKLRIDGLKKNLRVPNLPELDSLDLAYVDEEAAWNILEHCRPTITRLDLTGINMNSRPLSSNSDAYDIPNIKHMRISESNAFNFVEFNAEHLVSIELSGRDISDNVVWPQFPKLRELKISGSKCLPILMNSRETLENLSISNIYAPSDYASVVMPKLTDLHLSLVNIAFTRKICSLNHRSLEFMILVMRDLPNLDDGIKMERMRTVVLRYKYSSYSAQDRERIAEMCPNAEVVIKSQGNKKDIRDQMRSRYKSRNFSLDFINM